MRIIKVFIASSKELHIERLEFTDMIVQLDQALEPRGIRIEPVKWEYHDASMGAERKQTEYNNKLRECEMCLVLYWNEFGVYTKEEFDTAYESLKAGRNPQKLYIYFKEPATDIKPELEGFKASFATDYGHFYCTFENVDTMRLNFLLQFEQYNSSELSDEKLVQANKGDIEVFGQPMGIGLNNVPFAGNNSDYRQLQERLQKVKEEITTFENELAKSPNEAIEKLLGQKRSERYQLLEDISAMEDALLNTAKLIVSQTGKASNARLEKAKELFLKGDHKGANAVLDLDDIKADMEHNARLIDQARELEEEARKSLLANVEECEMKVKLLASERPLGWLEESSQIYEQTITRVRGRIKDNDLVLLISRLGRVYAEQSLHERALECHMEAQEIMKRALEDDEEDIAVCYENIACALSGLNKYQEALEYHQKALKIRERQSNLNKQFYPQLSLSYYHIAFVYNTIGEFQKAKDYMFKTLDILKTSKFSRASRIDGFSCCNLIGDIEMAMGHYDEALKFYDKVLEFTRSENEKTEDPDMALYFRNKGKALLAKGDFTQAMECCQKSLDIERQWYGDFHTNVANCYTAIGNIYYKQGEYPKALECYLQSQTINTQIRGEENLSVAADLNNIGAVYFSMDDNDKALQYFEKSLSIKKRVYGSKLHPSIADAYGNIGNAYRVQKDYDTALTFAQKALDIRIRFYGETNPNVAKSLSEIGVIYDKQGLYETALDYYSKALTIQLATLNADNPAIADSHRKIASVLYSQENYCKALEHYKISWNIREAMYGASHKKTVACLKDVCISYYAIGGQYLNNGDYEKAKEYCQKSLDLWKTVDGDHDDYIADNLVCIGYAHYMQGDNAMTERYLREAIEIKNRTLGESHPDMAQIYQVYGKSCFINKNNEAALNYCGKALELLKHSQNADKDDIITLCNYLSGASYNLQHYAEAIGYCKEEVEEIEATYGHNSPKAKRGYDNMAKIYSKLGEQDKAEECKQISKAIEQDSQAN